MRVTTDTITDDQIRELRQSYSVQRINNLLGTPGSESAAIKAACDIALAWPPAPNGASAYRKARARCADAWNARHGGGS